MTRFSQPTDLGGGVAITKWARWPIAAFYACGAFVHVANMLGWTGIDWLNAPLKWQVLDVAYLLIDCVVVWGMVLCPRIGLIALVVAATSQIVLYTVFRHWILDVPAEFAPTPDEASYLTTLVAFHLVTLLVIGTASFWGAEACRNTSHMRRHNETNKNFAGCNGGGTGTGRRRCPF